VQAKKETEHKHRQDHGKEAAAKEAPGALAVSHADIAYSAVKLDIELARHMLNRAKLDLDGGKTEPADEALLALK
jgi:hypothetical protein